MEHDAGQCCQHEYDPRRVSMDDPETARELVACVPLLPSRFLTRDAEWIAAAIARAATEREQLRTMGLTARERVMVYSEVEFRERWRSLIESLVVG